MPNREEQTHIADFDPAEVFLAGSHSHNIPTQIQELSVEIERGVEIIDKGVLVTARLDNVLGTRHTLKGEVEVYDSEDMEVVIGLYSTRGLATASLRLWLTESRQPGGTDISSTLGISILGNRFTRRLTDPVINEKMGRIMPEFARQYTANTEAQLRSSRKAA